MLHRIQTFETAFEAHFCSWQLLERRLWPEKSAWQPYSLFFSETEDGIHVFRTGALFLVHSSYACIFERIVVIHSRLSIIICIPRAEQWNNWSFVGGTALSHSIHIHRVYGRYVCMCVSGLAAAALTRLTWINGRATRTIHLRPLARSPPPPLLAGCCCCCWTFQLMIIVLLSPLTLIVYFSHCRWENWRALWNYLSHTMPKFNAHPKIKKSRPITMMVYMADTYGLNETA